MTLDFWRTASSSDEPARTPIFPQAVVEIALPERGAAIPLINVTLPVMPMTPSRSGCGASTSSTLGVSARLPPF
jgi:hypothetical protein